MKRDTTWCRRWMVFGPGAVASLLPTLLLTAAFAQPGHRFPVLLAFWSEVLVGPIRYWLPILFGHPSMYGLHPMAGASTWVYFACLPLTAAHPVRPNVVTGWVTALAFSVWYAWAFLTLAAYEY